MSTGTTWRTDNTATGMTRAFGATRAEMPETIQPLRAGHGPARISRARIRLLNLRILGVRNGFQDLVQGSGLSPSIEAIVTGRIGPVTIRQITPRCSLTQHPDNAVWTPPVVKTSRAAGLVWQDRLNDTPVIAFERKSMTLVA